MTKRPTITAAMKLEVLHRQMVMVQCGGCGHLAPLDSVQFDHHLALVDGGTHAVDNLRAICIPCHREKSAHEHKENCRAKRRAKKHRRSAKGAGSEGQDAQENGNLVHKGHRHSKRSWPSRKMKSRPFGKDTRI